MSAIPNAIEAHRMALKRYLIASRCYGGMSPHSACWDAAAAVSAEASKAEGEAWGKLRCEVPANLDELATYAIHLNQVVRELDHETEETSPTAQALEAISTACLSLAGQERLR